MTVFHVLGRIDVDFMIYYTTVVLRPAGHAVLWPAWLYISHACAYDAGNSHGGGGKTHERKANVHFGWYWCFIQVCVDIFPTFWWKIKYDIIHTCYKAFIWSHNNIYLDSTHCTSNKKATTHNNSSKNDAFSTLEMYVVIHPSTDVIIHRFSGSFPYFTESL